jgi:hypothetical protein
MILSFRQTHAYDPPHCSSALKNENFSCNKTGMNSEAHSVKTADTNELKNINQKILAQGEDLPLVTLKDGSRVQTGTVAAMLHNIKEYDVGMRGNIEKELELAIPTLIKVGLFDLFSPEEWIAGSSPGRRFVGQSALAYLTSLKA